MSQEKNRKQIKFDAFLKEEEISCFDVKAIEDESSTVLYRSYLDTAIGTMPLYVILDSTIYTVVRIVVGGGVVNDANRAGLLEFLNRENRQFKKFKYYVEDSDQTLYLDCVYMCRSDEFVPQLLYGLLNSLIEYIDEAVPALKSVMQIERLPEPFKDHEHHHDHDELASIDERLTSSSVSASTAGAGTTQSEQLNTASSLESSQGPKGVV
ncbi:MAG: hypothetical protein KHZ77_09200 [Veillonella sp.]|uniref:hypothetical protein n=1 Tax=Veillonella sp. TaxID=1926307 RepID=UPI0025E06E02|nr:hypothetical protein [Veillonella sp.]MBS4914294.1 hypothetical protein [Veillonella sp.]